MIKLSKKGSYAVKAVLYISNFPDILVKIKDISKDEEISETLLRRIIADLEKVSILKTVKGRGGGVTLGKKQSEINLYDLLNAVGEELYVRDCTKGLECQNSDNCSTINLFSSLQKGLNGILRLHTLDKIKR